MSDKAIETLLAEDRRYPPPEEFAAEANAREDIYDVPFEEFWEREGRERVTWFEPFTSLYEWELPSAKWYLGGKLNVSYNCLDRHVEAGLGDRVAYLWEGEPADEREALTYAELLDGSCRCANVLKELGVGKGTRVADLHRDGPRACRSRCSPARGSARRTRSSSAASRPIRSPTARTTWAARC